MQQHTYGVAFVERATGVDRYPANQPQSERMTSDVQAAARKLGLRLHVLHASTEPDFDAALATLEQPRAGAFVIGADASLAGANNLAS